MFSKFLVLAGTFTSTLALAQEAAPASSPGQGMLLQLPILLGFFALFWFGVIQPQRKQQAKQAEFLSKLERGAEVVTSGGIIGTIRGLTEKVVTLEVSPGTEIKVLRTQISTSLKEPS
jgi:preprotein translocase subunit YajC